MSTDRMELLKECDVVTYRSEGKGVNMTDDCVRVIHRRTGKKADATGHKSQHKNLQDALDKLIADLYGTAGI